MKGSLLGKWCGSALVCWQLCRLEVDSSFLPCPMDRPSPDPVFVLRSSHHPISCVQFTKQVTPHQSLLSGCTGGQVKMWDLSTRRCISSLDGHHGQGIMGVCQLDSGQIISHGRDGLVHTWDVAEGRRSITASLPVAATNFCKFAVWQSEDHALIAVPGKEVSEVRVVCLGTLQTVAILQPSQDNRPLGMPMCLNFLDKQRLVVGYEDGSIALWDIPASSMLSKKTIHKEPVMCLDVCTASLQGVSGSSTDQLVSWSISPQGEVVPEKEVSLTNPGIASLAIRPDSKILAAAGWDSRVRVWSWRKLKPLAVLSYHTATVNAVAYSAWSSTDGHLLAAGSKDKHISIWSLYNDSKT